MQRALLIGPVVLVLGCDSSTTSKKAPRSSAAAPGAASLDELRARATEALRTGDTDAYLDLTASPAFMLEHCPDEPDYADLEEGGEVAARGEQRRALITAVGACADAFDWAKATVERRGGGAAKATTLRCTEGAEEFEDLVTYYKVGDATWKVDAADDVYKVAGRYVVLDVPTCDDGTE